MIHAELIENEEEFLDLKDGWEELWKNSVSPSFFLTHFWVRCCWQELKSEGAMRIVVARKGNKLLAIAPLMKSRFTRNGLPVARLSFIEHPEAQIADILLRDSEERADALRVILSHLFRERSSDWHWLSLDKIPPDSGSVGFLTRLAEFSGLEYETRSSHVAPVISLQGAWEDYFDSRTPRFRKTLRNVTNRIARLGPVEVKSYTGAEGARGALEKLFHVSKLSWKASCGLALTSSEKRKGFFQELSQTMHEGGSLQVWLLEAGGVPIASEIQVRDGMRVHALRSDYDERYAESSPGTYLQAEILRRLFGGSCKEYSLGVGKNPYKLRWANGEHSLVKFNLYNRTVYSRLLRSVDHYAGSSLKTVAALKTLRGFFAGRAK